MSKKLGGIDWRDGHIRWMLEVASIEDKILENKHRRFEHVKIRVENSYSMC